MGSKMGAADPNYPKIQGLSRLSRLSYGIAATGFLRETAPPPLNRRTPHDAGAEDVDEETAEGSSTGRLCSFRK